jgi:hypothetical protein
LCDFSPLVHFDGLNLFSRSDLVWWGSSCAGSAALSSPPAAIRSHSAFFYLCRSVTSRFSIMADITKEDLRKEIAGKSQYFNNVSLCRVETRITELVEFICEIFVNGSRSVHVQNRAFYSCTICVCLKLAHKQWPHDATSMHTILCADKIGNISEITRSRTKGPRQNRCRILFRIFVGVCLPRFRRIYGFLPRSSRLLSRRTLRTQAAVPVRILSNFASWMHRQRKFSNGKTEARLSSTILFSDFSSKSSSYAALSVSKTSTLCCRVGRKQPPQRLVAGNRTRKQSNSKMPSPQPS